MNKPNHTVAAHAYQPTAADRHGAGCTCDNCAPWPNTCPVGCTCLICLVDSLAARPAPQQVARG